MHVVVNATLMVVIKTHQTRVSKMKISSQNGFTHMMTVVAIVVAIGGTLKDYRD